ncbi:hypothetical protein Pelo_15693 [Pelomyxa schiedti]|nr:hypothetical protein Pelo_15693 [Pelomyxa schiedti]
MGKARRKRANSKAWRTKSRVKAPNKLSTTDFSFKHIQPQWNKTDRPTLNKTFNSFGLNPNPNTVTKHVAPHVARKIMESEGPLKYSKDHSNLVHDWIHSTITPPVATEVKKSRPSPSEWLRLKPQVPPLQKTTKLTWKKTQSPSAAESDDDDESSTAATIANPVTLLPLPIPRGATRAEITQIRQRNSLLDQVYSSDPHDAVNRKKRKQAGILRKLEKVASVPERKAPKKMPWRDRCYISALISKYKNDYDMMARDITLNYNQLTPNQIERKIRLYKQLRPIF